MSETPNIDVIRDRESGKAHSGWVGFTFSGILKEYDAIHAKYTHYFEAYAGIVTALRTVPRDSIAAADAVKDLRDRIAELEAQVVALTPAPKERKLREYKGVTYSDSDGLWRLGSHAYDTVYELIYHVQFTDDDHAPLMALKDDPFEPVVYLAAAVAEVVRSALDEAWSGAHKPNSDWDGIDTLTDNATKDIMAMVAP